MPTYKIIQRKLDKISFFPMDKKMINLDDYTVTDQGEIDSDHPLEDLFIKYNSDNRPTGKYHYSLSVNDIVEIDGIQYLCQSFGWEKL